MMISVEDRASPAQSCIDLAQSVSPREVFHGSTDTSFASRWPESDDLPALSFRKGGLLTTATLSTAPSQKISDALHRACVCARTAFDNKASQIVILDMRPLTALYDFFVIVSGTSRRQIHTLAEEIDAALRAEGDKRMGIEGYEASKWVVQDYGDVLVHIFDPHTREYYSLEELWADAKRIDWERE